MSGNPKATDDATRFTDSVTAAAKADRRVRRTQDKLGDALFSLMQEKVFDQITVQEVLDRAGVGRATFYTHYRDKDDLLLSDMEGFFGMMSTLLTRRGASRERIVPVRELFAHAAEARDLLAALAASGKMEPMLEMGRGFFARSIEERLLLAKVPATPAERIARAHALSGALFSLLLWWLDHQAAATPEAMDALFHKMVWV